MWKAYCVASLVAGSNSDAMTQVVRHRPLAAKARVSVRVNPRGICGRQSGTGTGFLRVFRFSPVNISFHLRSTNSYHMGNA
jgi:hypothetical protein